MTMAEARSRLLPARWFPDAPTDEDVTRVGGIRPLPSSYNTRRPMTASAERLDQKKVKRNESKLRTTQAWQEAAWRYYDQISEIKFAFTMVGQIVSRMKVYPAFVDDIGSIPLSTQKIHEDFDHIAERRERLGDPIDKDGLISACKAAEDIVHMLLPPDQAGQFLQAAALNFSVAGEAYILWNPRMGRFEVASIDEVTKGDKPGTHELKQSAVQSGQKIPLPSDNYLARVWRSHPRYSLDAESTMHGVLDACEQFVLVDQAIRSITRSQMSAGAIFVPAGTVTTTGKTIEDGIIEVTVTPVEDESSAYQVVPLIIEGEPEHAKSLQRIDLSRQMDEGLLTTQDRALDRILRGIDVPKDMVAGLADIKYANGLLIDDNLYRAHIEPLIMLICDALTQAYYQPALRKAGVSEELAERFVLWYDPSAVVTRPDKSQAANEGLDRGIISAEAWRRTRGFSEQDAPDEEDKIRHMAKRAQIPPDIGPRLLEAQAPEFFQKERQAGQADAGLPPGVSEMLQGEPPPEGQPGDEAAPAGTEPSPLDEALGGGDVPPGGNQPPAPGQ